MNNSCNWNVWGVGYKNLTHEEQRQENKEQLNDNKK